MEKPVKMSFSIEELAKSSRTNNTNNVPLLELTSTQQKRKRSYDLDSDNSSLNLSDAIDCSSSDSDHTEQPKNKYRTTFTNSQLMKLERYYSIQKYLLVEDRPLLAKRLKLSQAQIKWWFQTRRMKEKRQIKSCNGPVDLSQFVGVGKPGQRLSTGSQPPQLSGYFSPPHYSVPVPMSQQTTPYVFSAVFPDIYPGHNYQFYNSPSPVQQYRL